MAKRISHEPSIGRATWRGHGDLSVVSSPGLASDPTVRSERPIRVLVVSDVLLIRAGLRHVLDSPGIVLIGEAGSCDDALSLAARERPHVVLVDLDLRSSKALKCVNDVLAAAPDSRVIVLSDRTRSADHHPLVELGATGVVLKSESPEILLKAIEKVHAGEVWLDRANLADVLTRIARRRHTEDLEAAKISTLTRREREIITLVGQGMKNGPISESLFVSEATVRNHLTSILDKLGLSDRFELAVYAFRQGLVHYPDAQERRSSTGSWPARSEASDRRRVG